ncbi:hypothetical protein [Streptomyces sp. ME19-01-6]|uniref:hypothetical protein n=1 Tax=Streptomyces sp. ME19-01-6 TaxID=3028686 RepID=UPI0029ABB24B|nr:hypothetical protein [Streptomyces sp. ME19-01-6]MDX3228716.1 hypothetical protein [Streptomyces sp. ME19-01-6]
MIAAIVIRPETVTTLPGIRFGLIDHALLLLEGTLGTADPNACVLLKRDPVAHLRSEAISLI